MEVLALLVMGLVNIACFMIGAKVGQTVQQGKDIELPTVAPTDSYNKRQAKKEAQAEQDRLNAIMRNIETYDGTSIGQEEVK